MTILGPEDEVELDHSILENGKFERIHEWNIQEICDKMKRPNL